MRSDRIDAGPITDAEAWAIAAIRDGYGDSPAGLGARMLERPDAIVAAKRHRPQGLGRMGGTMMRRLERKGLVYLANFTRTGRWYPTRATLTDKGRASLKSNSKDKP